MRQSPTIIEHSTLTNGNETYRKKLNIDKANTEDECWDFINEALDDFNNYDLTKKEFKSKLRAFARKIRQV